MSSAPLVVPPLVRVKPGALVRVGLYLQRAGHRRPLVLASDGLPAAITAVLARSLADAGAGGGEARPVPDGSFEAATALFAGLPPGVNAVVGIGGGKALDVAKYVAFLARLPFYAVPTSLSNDGFCSPQSSLTVAGRRRSLPAALPYGVVVDADVCLAAPVELWRSGVGDLAAKLTAVADWERAFHRAGTPVNDFAALLSDATVMQFLARPTHDAEGVRLLATALMLNGVAMQVAGSSRPASGSEHLISHALDATAARPRLHGLQVGLATYVVSRLQGGRHTDRVAGLFDATGFWDTVRADPFPAGEWLDAVRRAPTVKEGYHTVLSERDCVPEVAEMIRDDPRLRGCFAW